MEAFLVAKGLTSFCFTSFKLQWEASSFPAGLCLHFSLDLSWRGLVYLCLLEVELTVRRRKDWMDLQEGFQVNSGKHIYLNSITLGLVLHWDHTRDVQVITRLPDKYNSNSKVQISVDLWFWPQDLSWKEFKQWEEVRASEENLGATVYQKTSFRQFKYQRPDYHKFT